MFGSHGVSDGAVGVVGDEPGDVTVGLTAGRVVLVHVHDAVGVFADFLNVRIDSVVTTRSQRRGRGDAGVVVDDATQVGIDVIGVDDGNGRAGDVLVEHFELAGIDGGVGIIQHFGSRWRGVERESEDARQTNGGEYHFHGFFRIVFCSILERNTTLLLVPQVK
jgi:hypothetical protein